MSLFGTGRREGVLAVLLLMLLAFAVQSPAWILGQRRAGVAPATLDPAREASQGQSPWDGRAAGSEAALNQTTVLPALEQAGDALRSGEAPLWNPRARFGEPFALTGAPVHYPGFWPLLLPDGSAWLELVLALHGAIACMGMYRLLRAIALTRYTGFLGGAAYGLGHFWMASGDRLPEAAAAALLPMVLEATWRLLVKRNRDHWIAPLGIWLGLLLLTGSGATAPMGAGLCAFWFVLHLRMLERSEWWHAVRSFGLAWLVALCLSAPEWLTWLQLSGHLEPAQAATGHLQMGGFLQMLSPTALGDLRGQGPEALRSLNPGADPLELVLYPGGTVLFLLSLGLFLPKRTWLGLFWVLLGALGLALTIDGPIGNAARTLMGNSRPGAGLLYYHLAVVVLASSSLDNFFNAPTSRRMGIHIAAAGTVGCCLALALLALLWPDALASVLGRQGGTAAATQGEWRDAMQWLGVHLLLSALLFAALSGLFLTWQRLGVLRFKAAVVAMLMLELALVNFLCTPRSGEPPVGSSLAAEVHGGGRALAAGAGRLPPRSWLVTGEHGNAPGFVGHEGRGVLKGTADLLRAVDPSAVGPGPRPVLGPLAHPALLDDPLLAAAGVDLALSARPLLTREFSPDAPGPAMEFAGDRTLLHTAIRDRSTAKVRIHDDVVHAADRDEALQVLRGLGARRGTALVVEGAGLGEPVNGDSSGAQARLVGRSGNRVEIQLEGITQPAWLSLAEAWAPGWTVTVDGEPQPLRVGNLAFQAVKVPAGSSAVVFRYLPWTRTIGWPLAAGGALLAILVAVLAAVGVLGPKRYGRA